MGNTDLNYRLLRYGGLPRQNINWKFPENRSFIGYYVGIRVCIGGKRAALVKPHQRPVVMQPVRALKSPAN